MWWVPGTYCPSATIELQTLPKARCPMSEEKKTLDRIEQVREIMRDWETYPMTYDPEFARTYAGEWVVIHRGQVVAHGKDGSEVARASKVQKDSRDDILYVHPLAQQN